MTRGEYGPKLRDNEHALAIDVDAMVTCGLEPSRDAAIALDVASSLFFDADSCTYKLTVAGSLILDAAA